MGEGRNPWGALAGFIMEEQGCRGLDFTWVLHRVMLSGPCAAVLWIEQCILRQGQSLHFMQSCPGSHRALSKAQVLGSRQPQIYEYNPPCRPSSGAESLSLLAGNTGVRQFLGADFALPCSLSLQLTRTWRSQKHRECQTGHTGPCSSCRTSKIQLRRRRAGMLQNH